MSTLVRALATVGTTTRLVDFVALLKLRLNALVLGAVASGFLLGAAGTFDRSALLAALFGVLLAGGGASAINMALEADRDRKMERTRMRPVATGRVTSEEAVILGLILATVGTAITWVGAGWLPATLVLATVLLYTLVYTPLKTVTPLNTLVGAVPGALPPLIGWTAATGSLEAPALSLFGIVFLWQFPHFYAIASVYREDYERGGFAMLPVVDKGGLRTAHQTMLAAFAFVPVSLLPAVFRLAGTTYFTGAFGISLIFFVFSARACIAGTTPAWRHLLRVSLIVLPGLFVLMMFDRLPTIMAV